MKLLNRQELLSDQLPPLDTFKPGGNVFYFMHILTLKFPFKIMILNISEQYINH